ncbi:helix-turn-helix transcriptional regulator [Saccharopolyspora gloriosae]|uniref:helix-turn-helix domain-containing protein n=1 Tax=Saccharopolyspora gloriosae TaxID=455344 RepID=UPI001FB7A3D8|nr:helix-turn-helix transcriptional regulator [Saccharopolyspora gloriosae]
MSEMRSTENGSADEPGSAGSRLSRQQAGEADSGGMPVDDRYAPAGHRQRGTDRDSEAPPGRAPVSPMVRRYLLAGELRRLRHAARLTHADVAARLSWPQAKVSKIEGARQSVGIDAVIALADICHADTEHRDRLVDLARSARERGWWESYRDVLPADVRQHIGFEAEAVTVKLFATETVPDLVQTRDYAEAVREVRLSDHSAAELERSLEVLHRRQQRVESGDVRLDLTIAESSLRREVGGRGVLAGQLDRLRELARREAVTVRVLPFSAGALATDEPFSLLSFELDLPATVVRTFGSSTALDDDPVTVEADRALLRRLSATALSPDDSLRWLEVAGRSLVGG